MVQMGTQLTEDLGQCLGAIAVSKSQLKMGPKGIWQCATQNYEVLFVCLFVCLFIFVDPDAI
jgi:hypothetical protein